MSFTVFVREEQKKLPIPREKLQKIARFTFDATGNEEYDISLVVCDDRFIARLNETFMKRRGPTDVLAFSMTEGENITVSGKMLGDVVISADTAARQAEERGKTLEEEFALLFVHGLLHLLGFEHRNRREETVMQEYTHKIVMGVEQAV